MKGNISHKSLTAGIVYRVVAMMGKRTAMFLVQTVLYLYDFQYTKVKNVRFLKV